MTEQHDGDRQRDIERQREELRIALEEIEDRINPAKVAGRARRAVEDNPTPFLAAAAGVVATVAGIVALVVLRRR